MGLDMYLSHRRSKYNSNGGKNGRALTIIHEEEIGYWRKFNALHNFIVEEFADGVDECQKIELNIERVERVISVLSEVLANKEDAASILPNASGFFFGSQEYDEWYFKDVENALGVFTEAATILMGSSKRTKTAKRNTPDDPFIWKSEDIIYQASW